MDVRRLPRLLSPLLRFAFPTDCFGCGEQLGRLQHLGACPACWLALRPLEPPLCSSCALPRPPATDLLGPAGGRCAPCLLSPSTIDQVRAAVAYAPLARRFMLRVKLGRRRELLGPIAGRLLLTVKSSRIAAGCDVIAPVPSDRLADLSRGFSPSRELSRRLARRLGISHRGSLISRRLLRGRALKRLGPEMRRKRAMDAFFVRGRLAGESVLLVDDVMTTGASLEACATALKSAGAGEVRAVIWARALPSNY